MRNELDLHGENKESAVVLIDEFITDAIIMRTYEIKIVHGKGLGILKRATHEYLASDKRVESYKLDNFNDGMTIVKIKNNLTK